MSHLNFVCKISLFHAISLWFVLAADWRIWRSRKRYSIRFGKIHTKHFLSNRERFNSSFSFFLSFFCEMENRDDGDGGLSRTLVAHIFGLFIRFLFYFIFCSSFCSHKNSLLHFMLSFVLHLGVLIQYDDIHRHSKNYYGMLLLRPTAQTSIQCSIRIEWMYFAYVRASERVCWCVLLLCSQLSFSLPLFRVGSFVHFSLACSFSRSLRLCVGVCACV